MTLQNIYHTILLCTVICFFQSCKVSKFLGENEVLYKESVFKFEQNEKIENVKELDAKLQNNLYPAPNKKFIGLFYTKLWLYKKVTPKPDKEKGFKHWLKYKLGEKPVLITDVDKDLMSIVADKTMQDYGYFNTKTTHTTEQKNKKGTIIYNIKNGGRTYVDSIIYPNTNSDIDSIVKNHKNLKLKVGQPYELEKIKADKLNLATDIRSMGYYNFNEKDLYFVIDTSLGGNFVDVYYKIKPPKNDSIHHKFYISNINIYPTFESEISKKKPDKFKSDFVFKDNYHIYQNYNYIGEKALFRNIIIEKNDVFSVKDYENTAARLNNLDIFKYVNLNYSINEKDSLTIDIRLTPGKYQSVRADIEASTSNRSFLGSSVAVSYNNRNLFKGAENLNIKGSAGTEFQFIANKATLNIIDVNFQIDFAIPRLLTWFKTKKIKSPTPPKTIFSLQENYQKWLQYYTLNSLNFQFGYDWRTQKGHHHKLNPFFFNTVNLLNTTAEFDEILGENPLLEFSFNSSVIIGGNYNFSVSTQKDKADKSYLFFSGFAEMAGNVGWLTAKAFSNKNEPYRIFDIPFAQYAKFDADLRHYYKINSGSMFVSRANIGVGFAYGNSEVLPYIKQFFIGGPSTIRAFQFRSLGPGRFSTIDSDEVEFNPLQQSGDIRILLNAEYRYTIWKFLKGAFFVDAGNVWLRQEDENRPDSQFKFNSFVQQMALGTGTGIRLDFDFFAIRADLGVPLYKPYGKIGERWITQFPQQGFREWRKDNFVWNIAIGYPF